MILGAAQRLHTLAMLRGGLVNVFRHWCRAHERHCVHARMHQQCVHGCTIALDYVEHAIGQPGFAHQSGQHQAG